MTRETFLYTFDANGNVGQLLNAATGALAAHYEYDPFGNTLVAGGPEAQNNVFRFSTKFTDAESGLLYYGYRYYAPGLGRWLNRDPIGEAGGLNLCAYVRNNPLNFIDLLGLQSIVDDSKIQTIIAILNESEPYTPEQRHCHRLYTAVERYLDAWNFNTRMNIHVIGDHGLKNALNKIEAFDNNASLVPLLELMTNIAWSLSPAEAVSFGIVVGGTTGGALLNALEQTAHEQTMRDATTRASQIYNQWRTNDALQEFKDAEDIIVECTPRRGEICEELAKLANTIKEGGFPIPEILTDFDNELSDAYFGKLLAGIAKEKKVPIIFENGRWKLKEPTCGSYCPASYLFYYYKVKGGYADALNGVGYQP